MIRKHDLDMIYITGPGHGGPGLVANAYFEGTYSEVYMRRLALRGAVRAQNLVGSPLGHAEHPRMRPPSA